MPISKPPFVNLYRSKFSEVVKLTLTSLSALFSSADPEQLWGELVAHTWACCWDRSWLGCLGGERFEQRLGFRAGQKCCAVFTDSNPELTVSTFLLCSSFPSHLGCLYRRPAHLGEPQANLSRSSGFVPAWCRGARGPPHRRTTCVGPTLEVASAPSPLPMLR